MLLAQLGLVAILYWPTLQLAFVSDAWVYLARLRGGVWDILTEPTGYHYQPVACAWVALIRACVGESATAFQAVLLLQLGLFGYLTYQLGRRLLPDAEIAFLGSLLVIGSAAFYETSYWPLAGNMHLLAAQLYLVAVILAIDVGRDRFGRAGPWALGLTVLAAVFTHPVMITAVPVCALSMYLTACDRVGAGNAWRKVRGNLVVLAAVTVPFALTRLAFAEDFGWGPKPGLGRMQAYWLVSRGVVAVFSLRGSEDAIHKLITLGTNVRFLGTAFWLFVAVWLLAVALGAGLCLWRTRTPGLRILVTILAVHGGLAAIAGGMSSRQSHLPAVCAGLLTAWALHTVARSAAGVTNVSIYRNVPRAGVLLLIAAAWPDHRAAAIVHQRASNLSRSLVEEIRMLAPLDRGPVNLTLVNMPGYTVDRGIVAATFANGLVELTRLTSPAVAAIDLWRVQMSGAPTDFANGSTPITREELRTQLLEPSRIAVVFRMPTEIRPLIPDRAGGLSTVVPE